MSWTPLRAPKAYVAWQWRAIVDEYDLKYTFCRLDDGVGGEWEYAAIEGQDGWAYEAAQQFFTAASALVTDHQKFYGSTENLLKQIITKTRYDLRTLEAVEAIAIALCAKTLSYERAGEMLQQMGIWAAPPVLEAQAS